MTTNSDPSCHDDLCCRISIKNIHHKLKPAVTLCPQPICYHDSSLVQRFFIPSVLMFIAMTFGGNTSLLWQNHLQIKTNQTHLKIGIPKRKVIFQPSIFSFYVSFSEGKFLKQIKQSSTTCTLDTLTVQFHQCQPTFVTFVTGAPSTWV